MTKDEALAEVQKHGTVTLAAKALKVPRSTFQHWMKGAKGATGEIRPKAGKSLSDFRAIHDKSFIIPVKIKEGLKLLGSGWEYEAQFGKICGISLADLGNFRDQFSDYVVVVRRDGKRAWAGTPAVAQKMKDMVS